MASPPTTLITGASGGIGAALAWQAAASGHHLILTGRRTHLLTELAEALTARHGRNILTIESDLSDPEGAEGLINSIIAHGWRVDHLINNAGFGTAGALATLPPARIQSLLQVNILSLTTLTRQFLPPMLARGSGGILNVASLAAFQPGPLMAAYYASKAYVLSLTEALHHECKGSGVRVSCLCPGATATGFATEAHMENSRLFLSNPMSAEDVARIGWRAFLRGRRVIIPGWKNKTLALLSKLSPHALSLPLVRKLHESA